LKFLFCYHTVHCCVNFGENDKVQQKITSFQTEKGWCRADNQDPILKELTTLGTMVLEINTAMNRFPFGAFSSGFLTFCYFSTGLELSKLVSLLEVDDLSFTFRFGVDSSGLFLFDCITSFESSKPVLK
jgi:hypothetical protein